LSQHLWASRSDISPWLCHHDGLCPDKLTFQFWITLFKQELEDLLKIFMQFISRGGLREGSRKSRNISDKKLRVRAPLNNSRKGFHDDLLLAYYHSPSKAISGFPANPAVQLLARLSAPVS
jgi:hypothetical protein